MFFLLHQGKDLSVNLDVDGHLVFTVGGVKVVSRQTVNNDSEFLVSLCRERNGMLKIYLNGELDQSAYDTSIVNPDIRRGSVIIKRTKISEVYKKIPFACVTWAFSLILMKIVLRNCSQPLTSVSVVVQRCCHYPRDGMISGPKVPCGKSISSQTLLQSRNVLLKLRLLGCGLRISITLPSKEMAQPLCITGK